MAPLMFMLSVSTLAYRGMYHNHKRFKFILTALLTIFIFFVDFRFGLKNGFASLTTKMAYSFVAGLSIIFASSTVRNRLREIYKIIECGDRQGFVSLYRDWEVIFNEDNKTDSE